MDWKINLMNTLFIFLKQSSATCQVFTGSKSHVFPSLKSLKCSPFMRVRLFQL